MLSRLSAQDFVKSAMERNAHDERKAVNELIALAATDTALRDLMVVAGIKASVRQYFANGRRAWIPTPAAEMSAPDLIEKAAQKAHRRLFWDRYCLYGHKPLRAATKSDLLVSMTSRQQQIAGAKRNLGFEADIHKQLKSGDSVVSQELTLKKVEEIARKHNVLP